MLKIVKIKLHDAIAMSESEMKNIVGGDTYPDVPCKQTATCGGECSKDYVKGTCATGPAPTYDCICNPVA